MAFNPSLTPPNSDETAASGDSSRLSSQVAQFFSANGTGDSRSALLSIVCDGFLWRAGTKRGTATTDGKPTLGRANPDWDSFFAKYESVNMGDASGSELPVVPPGGTKAGSTHIFFQGVAIAFGIGAASWSAHCASALASAPD
jgi:hypothetical protein